MIRHLHAPRTGGTALAWALRGSSVKRCGHAKRLVDLDPDDEVVTTVRDPLERFASTWGWLRRTGHRVGSPAMLARRSECIVSPGLDILRPQTYWLGPSDRLLAQALWVGRTETLDADYAVLRDLLGHDGALPPTDHADRNASDHAPLDPETAEVVRDRYADDYRLLEDLEAPMASKKKPPRTVTVIPAPSLHPTVYVRGVPARGREMSPSEAQPLLDAGLVIIKPPDAPATDDKEV